VSDLASIVSAGTAALAAGFGGANLYVSGRRDHRRWAREALVDLFVSYLDASFSIEHAFVPPSPSHLHQGELETAEQRLSIVRQAHDLQMNALTKLRILTSKRVIELAVALHEAGHRVTDLHLAVPAESSSDIDAAHDDLWAARDAFVSSCQRALGLRGPLPAAVHTSPVWGGRQATSPLTK
jgi:hypothetical protein